MSDFDRFVSDYESIHAENIRKSGFHPSYFDESKVREICNYLRSEGTEKQEIRFLNFGCGIGKSEKYIRSYFPKSVIFSIDVSERSIALARERNREFRNMTFAVFDGFTIPFDGIFDVIFAANVFHHIPFEMHLPLLRNLHEKLHERGVLFMFEHNPFNPLTVRTVRDCAFDKDAQLLNPKYANAVLAASGFKRRRISFTIFFPKFLSFLIPYEKYLRKIPLGAQYYCIAKK
jgi:SAM-dependent methyltransferase